MSRIEAADSAITAAERINRQVTRITIMVATNIVLTAMGLGAMLAVEVLTWRGALHWH